MTGYGRASCELAGIRYNVEIRSVNNKILNLSIRTPLALQEKEWELRNELSRLLERWSVIVNIDVDKWWERVANRINESVVIDYYHQIINITEKLAFEPTESALSQALKMPGIFWSEELQVNDDYWNTILTATMEAMKLFDVSREREWALLEVDIHERVRKIEDHLLVIETFEKARIERIKSRIQANLAEFIEAEKIDTNRFEQEVIYYLEQIDFTEEKVRLSKHCNYFMETLKLAGPHGKKLEFIVQEIGREINTLGSKARDADIQKLVVQMKDELEKVKEQLANVL